MKGSLKKNLGLQTIYQLLNTVLPLITAPYLARVLGAEQQGVFSFTQSVVNYFVLFAMLGITNHGTRYIAEHKASRLEQGEAFISIYMLQALSSILMLVAYIIYMCFFCHENKFISVLQMIAIIACIFDINWFFFGIEEFGITVSRNIVIRLITVFAIFLFVKKQEDLWIYTLLMVGSTLVNNVVLWFYLPKYVLFTKPNIQGVKENIKPIIVLFVPILAMSFYHVMDKTMLGLLSDYKNCGYYYNADKIINIPIGIINGISTVLFPRMVKVLTEESKEDFLLLFSKSMEGIILASVVMMFGIVAISNEFVPWFFGSGFETCIKLVSVLAPVIIVKSISTTIRYQYLIPKNKEKIFMISVFIGAMVNIFVNFIYIPRWGALGAIVGTLVAEIMACVVQIAFVLQEINILKIFKNTIPYFIMGFLMYIIIREVADNIFFNNFINIVIEVIVGVIVFFVECMVYMNCVKNNTLLNELLMSLKK